MGVLPGKLNLEARIGTTFDAQLVVYPSQYSSLKWTYESEDSDCNNNIFWKSTSKYEINQVTIGSDGKAYAALIVSTGVNPVGDVTGHWEKLTPFNLTGCSGEMKIGGETIVLKNSEGITFESEGTIKIEATPAKTSVIPGEGKQAYALLITDTQGKTYEYVTGFILWKSQQVPPNV